MYVAQGTNYKMMFCSLTHSHWQWLTTVITAPVQVNSTLLDHSHHTMRFLQVRICNCYSNLVSITSWSSCLPHYKSPSYYLKASRTQNKRYIVLMLCCWYLNYLSRWVPLCKNVHRNDCDYKIGCSWTRWKCRS